MLDETETIWLLDIPGVCVSSDSEEAQVIQELNEKYKEVRIYSSCHVLFAASD